MRVVIAKCGFCKEENIFPVLIEKPKEEIKVCMCVYCGYVFFELTDMNEDKYSQFINAVELK